MHADAHRKQTPKLAGAGIVARTCAERKLPAKPAAAAARFEAAKNRPRSVTGIARPTTSIHAGISTPPTPVMTRSRVSSTPSTSAGARSATTNAASASTKNGTRSQTV